MSILPNIFVAAATGDIAALTAAVSATPSAVNEADKDQVTPLILAARLGQIEAVKFLIEHFASLDAVGPECGTAVCWAARNGHAHIVDLLLTAGANRAIGGGPGRWAYTSPLGKQWDVLAVTRADPDVAAVYRSGGLPVERRDNYTMTELTVKQSPKTLVTNVVGGTNVSIDLYTEIDSELQPKLYSKAAIEAVRTGPDISIFAEIPQSAISHYDPSATFTFTRATPIAPMSVATSRTLPGIHCGSVMIKGPLTQLGFAHYSLRLFAEQAGYRNIGMEVREIYHYFEAPESDGNITELQLALAQPS